jgi:acetyl esterase/lipase
MSSGLDSGLLARPNVRTQAYKTLPNGTPVLADIYITSGPDWSIGENNPIVLFFHAGGLTAFNRKFIYPSLVQAVLKREWTLVSVDYRLLPLAKPEEIWEDVKDAYEFVVDELPGVLHMASASRGKEGSRKARRIIVAGASAGRFNLLLFFPRKLNRRCLPPQLTRYHYMGVVETFIMSIFVFMRSLFVLSSYF